MEGSKHRELKAVSAGTPTALQRPFLVYLEAILPSLSPIERQIGEYILEDPERVLSSTVGDMHLGSGARIGSIVGFCRRLGFRGFTNLKISVARGLPQIPMGYREGHEHALLSVADKVFQCHIQSLRDARLLNSERTLQKVSEVLEGSRRIEFFSIGMSYPIAYAACGKLRLLGMSAATQSDSHLQVIAATQLQRGDVAFGISFSGRTRETVQCLQIARESKVATVSVTNCMMSPITEYSDLVLYATPSEIQYFRAPLASRITQLAILDTLFVLMARKRRDQIVSRLQRVQEMLAGHSLVKSQSQPKELTN